MTKGPDRQIFSVQRPQAADGGGAAGGDGAAAPAPDQPNYDEVGQFEDGRYVSAAEAFWRIYGFEQHGKFPAVLTLPVHAPDEQTVFFDGANQEAMQNAAASCTQSKLMAYFDFMSKQRGPEDKPVDDLRYTDMPRYCTWNASASQRGWHWRKKGPLDDKGRNLFLHLGRMPYFAPTGTNRELFHIRLLLAEKPAKSFDDLRTVDGHLCETFHEACVKLGLLDDDQEMHEVMTEVSTEYAPSTIRYTFCSLLLHCNVGMPKQLLEDHMHAMAEDVFYRWSDGQRLGSEDPIPEPVYHGTLAAIEEILERNNRSLADFNLPEVNRELVPKQRSAILADETVHDIQHLQVQVEETEPMLTAEQNAVYQSILCAIDLDRPTVFSLDACGGSGKTFVLNLILRKLRSRNEVALATAFSGIAATLLDKGRTLHGR